MRELLLSDRHPFVAFVDDEDYDYLIQWRWTFKRSTRRHNNHIYACRNTTNGSRASRIKIMLHNVILDRMGKPRPTPKHTADHKNRNTLDCQRHNLDWRTKKQQRRNQGPRCETHSGAPS